MSEVYFSLGSNLGDRRGNISTAVSMMEEEFGIGHVSLSGMLETEPWGFETDDKFINCAVRFDLEIHPEDILKIVKNIEKRMGRDVANVEYDSEGRRIYKSRIIDIDILLYGDLNYSSGSLTVPHPLMAQRDFVMIPLKEIASEAVISSFPEIFG